MGDTKMKVAKKLFAIIAFAACTLAAASAEDMSVYVRGNLGYSEWHVEGESFGHFALKSAVGLNGILPLEELSLEAFFDMDFGSDDISSYASIDTHIFTPGVRAVYAKSLADFTGNKDLKKLVPYAGAGICFPFVSWETEVKYYNGNGWLKYTEDDSEVKFAFDSLVGMRYDFTDNLSATGEMGVRFGGIRSHSITVGVMYQF